MSAGTSGAVSHNGWWDSYWTSLEAHMVQLYTSGVPQTIHQFWQRCYFEDLWASMGTAAPQARYLELGAGRGTTSMYLASRNCDVTMVDLSSAGFKVAEANFAREGLKLPTLVQADARQTNLPADKYDCIFSIGLLEHFEDPTPVLREMVRLLRPGGLQFAVIIPDRSPKVRYIAHALFCPWVLVRELMPEVAVAWLRELFHRPAARRGSDLPRTAHTRGDYLKAVEGLDVEAACCIPYNPYHPVYDSAALEARIAIPLYRAHRALKQLYSGYPLLATAPGVASCDLFTFRKASR